MLEVGENIFSHCDIFTCLAVSDQQSKTKDVLLSFVILILLFV